MTNSNYDIFISYKRKSLATANNLYYRLTMRGYSTFFDLEEMRRDNFNTQLFQYIENAKDVFVILEEGSLDACTKDDWEMDWFCCEISFALEKKKNIIPILLGGYKMPSEDFLPDKLKDLSFKQSPEFSFSFFEAYLDKLIEKDYLLSKPNLQEKATSVFKFYSNEVCQVFKEGKLVCSLEGMSDEPYYLPVPRKGDYRFKIVNVSTNETKIIDEHVDAIEEKNVRIRWHNRLIIEDLFYGIHKKISEIHRAKLLLIAVFIIIILVYVIFSVFTSGKQGNNSQSSQIYHWTGGVTNKLETNDILSSQVLINARLLDTVFIRNDSAISKAINYNAYMGIEENEDGTVGLEPFYDFFHYTDTCIKGRYSIIPHGLYVGDYYLRDSITIQDHRYLILGEDYYTNLHYPVLDVTLVNNSPNTILINELLIEVEESYIDPKPFVIFYESGGVISIENRGWKSWKSAVFRFSLLPDGQKFDKKYKFEVPISSSKEEIIIPMYDFFVQSGIDFEKICTSSLVSKHTIGEIPSWYGYSSDFASMDSLQKLLFPIKIEKHIEKWKDEDGKEMVDTSYVDPYLVLYGEIVFDNKFTFKVGGTVRFLTSEGWGAPMLDCSRVFDVKLKNSGQNYVVKYPVSHYLKSGDVDRIAIQINADKTSHHTFKVRLYNVNQIDIATEPINLLIFKYN